MLRSLALAALANGAAAQTTTAGLTIAVDANAAEASAVGAQLAVVDAAISEDGWTAGTTALDAYEAVPAGANTLTLETIGTQFSDNADNTEFAKFSEYHTGSVATPNNYADTFVRGALTDTVPTRLPLATNGGAATVTMATLPDVAAAQAPEDECAAHLTEALCVDSATAACSWSDGACSGRNQRGGAAGIAEKSREEMIMKGLSLQSVLMGSINLLYKAKTQCDAGDTSSAYVDQAWALFAAPKGPIALGEKRCPQFGTCEAADSGAGVSAANTRILAGFLAAQTAAAAGECAALLTQIETVIVPQAYVPIIQGLYREAWEVDESMSHVHFGADGFVEVVEGWAFAMAVLPRIAACDAAVAATVVSNMRMRTDASDPAMVADGYGAVIAAVETTYACLGITCADVRAMNSNVAAGNFKGPPLWNVCDDTQGGTATTSGTARTAAEVTTLPTPNPAKASDASRTAAMMTAAVAAVAALAL